MSRKSKIWADERGAAAVELALIAPVMVIIGLGLLVGWSLASAVLYMRASVETARDLYIQGAGDDGYVRQAALHTWQSRPQDGEIAISRIYRCGKEVVTATSVCTGPAAPAIYVRIKATASWTAPMPVAFLDTNQMLVHEALIRVR
jgi:Flp pilus assembly protein TadG